MPLELAAELGCCIHSRAADLAVDRSGQLGLTATDTLSFLRAILNSCPSGAFQRIKSSEGKDNG